MFRTLRSSKPLARLRHRFFFLLGFYFYFYSVETPTFEKYSVGCYSVFFNYKKYSVLQLLGFMKFQKSTRLFLLGFDFLIKKYSVRVYSVMFLLGFQFLIKKYSVGVYSVIRLFAKSTRLRFTRLLPSFYESTRLSQSHWLRSQYVDGGGVFRTNSMAS